MERVEVSAPGKAVLIGEYAVLFGAPAAVAAVDRRAVVTLRPATDEVWEVSAPGFAPGSSMFDLHTDGTVHWQDEALGRESFALVETVLNAIGAAGAVNLTMVPPSVIVLDTSAFFEPTPGGGTKLGLGSSAALTVALTTAIEMWPAGGDLPRFDADRLQRLVDLHRAVQGGSGSGIDVAASQLGGVIRFRLDDNRTVAEAAPVDLPDELRMVFAWTGKAASTGDFLAQLEARLTEAPGEVRPVLDELAAVSKSGVAALSQRRTMSFLDAVDVFWEGLEHLGEAIQMPILSDEHRVLKRVASVSGVRYKPSGAGGGDLGIGFTGDDDAAATFSERVTAEGFRTLAVRVDPNGTAGTCL